MKRNHSNCVFFGDPPNLINDQIEDFVFAKFGLRGSYTVLNSERDQNFKITTDSDSYVLKISNDAEDINILLLQSKMLSHLECSSISAGVPKVIKGLDGRSLYKIQFDQNEYDVRLVSYVDGQLFSKVDKTKDLLKNLGRFLGLLSRSLIGFGDARAHRFDFLWNLDNAIQCKAYLKFVENADHRGMLANIFFRYESNVLPRLSSLRMAVTHHDANDNNIIVKHCDPNQICGLIDYGDICYSRQINELAIAMAYALIDAPDLYSASRLMIEGYVENFSLQEDEIDVLFELIRIRLTMSICISSMRAKDYQQNEYLFISQQPAVELLKRFEEVNPIFMTTLFRHAAGFTATRQYHDVVDWLVSGKVNPVNMFKINLKTSVRRVLRFDGCVENSRVIHFQDLLTQHDNHNNIEYLIGLYGEDRNVYQADQFRSVVTPESRTMHLGLDVFIEANTALYAPLAGIVYSVVDNNFLLDYGPTIILKHHIENKDVMFYTLYGHLSKKSLVTVTDGQQIAAGQLIGYIGEFADNGGWAPHLHFQLMTDILGLKGNFNGVAEKSLWPVWQQICPDPNLITQLTPESFDDSQETEDLSARRNQFIGPSLSVSYNKKLQILRGKDAYLYDQTGRQYLDCVNNICHVGHCHPHVVDAIESQARLLNTNTRYLHPKILDYAERLANLLPDPLSVVYFVNSGTEANELALRIARTATGVKETIVLDWGYHGNSAATVEISPYKFKRKGGFQKPEFVEIAEFPDPFRGNFKGLDKEAGIAYANSVLQCVKSIQNRTGHGPAAFIAESISGVGGQVVYPHGYLQSVYQYVRQAGGVCIADEVQCGFGRVGSHFWAFELQGVVPDIVVLGKPMGNGHPLAAVVTTPDLANKFANGMEYFNSFGGNPVSASAGMAVLDVIENESLMQHADKIGKVLINKFNTLKYKYHVIGDIRGVGFFLGIELINDSHTLEPASELATKIVNDLRENGVLFSTDGPYENVLKFKPPMVFSELDADFLCEKLDQSLQKFTT